MSPGPNWGTVGGGINQVGEGVFILGQGYVQKAQGDVFGGGAYMIGGAGVAGFGLLNIINGYDYGESFVENPWQKFIDGLPSPDGL